MTGDFAGKSVVVTGGGRGIGRAIAEAFATPGAKVVIGARTPSYGEKALAAIRSAGGTAAIVEGDISTQADCEALVAAAVEQHGGLDIVVHAAADIPNGGIDATDEAIRRGFDSIVMAGFWLARAARPHLAKLGEGRMVFIGSICGPTTMVAGRMAYGVCKSGLDAFVRGAALGMVKEGITVNSIEPGVIASARPVAAIGLVTMQAIGARSPVGRVGTSEEIAHATLFLAAIATEQLKSVFDASAASDGLDYDAWALERSADILMRRIGTPADMGAAAAFLCSDLAGYITGQFLLVDGGIIEALQ